MFYQDGLREDMSVKCDADVRTRSFIVLFGFIAACVLNVSCRSGNPELKRERKIVAAGLEILRNGTPLQRDSTIRTFYSIKNADLLIEHLDDPDQNIKIAMISALGFIKDKAAAPAPNGLLTATRDYLLRETVLYALGEICDTSSAPVLAGLLADPSTDRDLRLSIPITLASFGHGERASLVVKAFADILRSNPEDVELCSYVSVGVLEVLNPDNAETFQAFLPQLRRMSEQRKVEAGEDDGIYTNFVLTIQELEKYGAAPAS